MKVLLLGDCLEHMKSMPDRSIDCFICDLPYGQLNTGYDRENQSDELKNKLRNQTKECCDWDVKIDLEKFWLEVKRLCKDDHTPVLMFCNTKFGYELIKSNPSWFRYDLVWDKGHGVSFLLANKQPMKSHEMIYVFSKKGAFYKRIDEDKGLKPVKRIFSDNEKINGRGLYCKQYGVNKVDCIGNADGKRCPLSVIPVAGKTTRGGHPTEKPVELYDWLLQRYVPDNGTVLDPTAGSFNSVMVAHKLGFKAIGIEKDAGFFFKAVKKLNDIK